MNFLKNIFNKPDAPIQSNEDFWNWFVKNEKSFFKTVKAHVDIEKGFFDKISPKLAQLKEGFFFLTGMLNDNTAELVLTADGTIKNFVFVEQLVNDAPKLDGWKFTALKPPIEIDKFAINMYDYQFKTENIHFYANDNPYQPDEIDITVVHDDLNENNEKEISTGIFIFLDNYLGELNFATMIDNIVIRGKDKAEKELVPIAKLKAFLTWREKEFIEKYDGIRHNTDNDEYGSFEAESKDGQPFLAMLNMGLLNWDAKASHPWMMAIEIKYDGRQNSGLPDQQTFELLNEMEDELMLRLSPEDGYLNVGRETGDGLRTIYFACKEFRKPAKAVYDIEQAYAGRLNISYEIYKDKYWRSLARYEQ
ncbi:DUF695 domain-containing protein [Pedobacter frigoris]|uniref:DUF695 domain-containing protein n=1 Tax=Pedobacter frigoris TaxID=2571272 RepID=UPI00293020C5|nr:DUF695 domain-containing protein [Pedobacter frigoris]